MQTSINREFPLPKGAWLLKAPKELTCLKSPTRTADFLLNTGASQLRGRGRDDNRGCKGGTDHEAFVLNKPCFSLKP